VNRRCSTRYATIFLALPVFIVTGAALSRHAHCAEKPEASALKTIRLAAGQIVCGPGDIEGNLRKVFTVDGVKMGVCICSDIGIPGIRDTLAKQGCQVLLMPTAGGGGREHIYHPGHSSIIDSRGRIVALLPGEYVIDYLEPRMIHGLVMVQTPRTTTAEKGTKTCPR
jgi:predicted amidohydrolase